MNATQGAALSLIGLSLLCVAGCVERTMKIQTSPPGAMITVNDEEVGPSPTKFTFLWYGKYEIVARKPGYRTLRMTYDARPPWYQIPPIDFVTETMVPGTIHDDHDVPAIELTVAEPPTVEQLVGRASELRETSQRP